MPPDAKSPKNDPEIEQAVRRFEVESTISYPAVKFYRQTSTPKMIQVLIKHSGGAIKTERQAEYFLFGLVILGMLLSGYLFFKSFYRPAPKLIPGSHPFSGGIVNPNEFPK